MLSAPAPVFIDRGLDGNDVVSGEVIGDGPLNLLALFGSKVNPLILLKFPQVRD